MSIRAVKKIDNLVPIKNVVISVFDKNNLDVLVRGIMLNCGKVMFYSSGGTHKVIAEILGPTTARQCLREVSQYTGQPESDGGLVKTLHHKLYLGYLTETYCPAHQADLKREQAVPIDLAVINFYPFASVVKSAGITIEEARGYIDVGGPSALRACAKNWHRVMTLPSADLDAYNKFLEQLKKNKGCTDLKMRFEACRNSFGYLSRDTSEIYSHLLKVNNFEEALKDYTIL